MTVRKRRPQFNRNFYILLAAVIGFASLITALCVSATSGADLTTATEPPETPTSAFTVSATQTPRPVKNEPAQAAPEPDKSQWTPNQEDVEYIAKTLYGECRGVASKAEQAAVAWCILNRVDSNRYTKAI